MNPDLSNPPRLRSNASRPWARIALWASALAMLGSGCASRAETTQGGTAVRAKTSGGEQTHAERRAQERSQQQALSAHGRSVSEAVAACESTVEVDPEVFLVRIVAERIGETTEVSVDAFPEAVAAVALSSCILQSLDEPLVTGSSRATYVIPVGDSGEDEEPASAEVATAEACSRQGRNQCVIEALEGRDAGPRAAGLLVEAHRALGQTAEATLLMRDFVARYPRTARALLYQASLESQERRASTAVAD